MIISEGGHQTLTLPAGEVLTVIASTIGSGTVYRLSDSVGGQAQAVSPIVAGETQTFGPFGQTARFDMVCAVGYLTYSTAPVDLTALSLGANSQIAADPSYGDSGSYQPIASDLELEAGAGTSDAGDTAFLAPVMGNVHGDGLTKTHNYIAGIIGALSVLGIKASVLPVAGGLFVLMDGVTEADGIVTAHIDGGDPSSQTNARAAFAVSQANNHASSGVEFGMDLYFVPSSELNDLLSGTAKPFTPSKGAVRFPNGLWLVTLDTAITANVTTTSAPTGSWGMTSHATGKGKIFASDGVHWQFASVS